MQIPRRIALAAMGLIAIAASASAPPATDTAAAEEAALRAADQTFMRAYRKGDLETVVALYTEDAVPLPVNAPAAKGPDAISKYFVVDMASLKPGDESVHRTRRI
jgi:ketosteroid isomerase-like protein